VESSLLDQRKSLTSKMDLSIAVVVVVILLPLLSGKNWLWLSMEMLFWMIGSLEL